MRELPLLVVMAKAPICGAVKTRLAKETGAVSATALNRTLTAAMLREVSRDARFRTVLAISPDTALRARLPSWRLLRIGKRAKVATPHPPQRGRPNSLSYGVRAGVRGDSLSIERIEQGGGDIGQRMQRIFDRCGSGPLIIVGTDIPFVTRDIIARAFKLLSASDAVFGPAEDGGYWLVGLRRRPKCLKPFDAARWSSPYALTDTLANLSAHRVAFAQTLFDIDTACDYRRYMRERYR